ncbi:MAG: ABC-2 family transporter protein [Candidatus Levybacteria bacterium]|nr:ABC-2 family transporter protein [Candidatus Levybacteria bacterium]
MKRYFYFYLALIRINGNTFIAYRGNFLNSVLSSFVWGIFSIVSILLLTSKTSSLFGWSRNEIIMLTAFHAVVMGIFHMIFSRNFEYFSRIIDLGQLDSFLLKPIDSQFFLSTRYINYASIIRIAMGVLLIAYLLKRIPFPITPLHVLLSILFMICGILLLYAIWYILITVTIWANRLSNMVEVLYTISGIMRFPGEMYKELSFYLFLFLFPLTLVLATPLKFLLGRFDGISGVIMIIFTGALFFISRRWWKFALKHYISASS